MTTLDSSSTSSSAESTMDETSNQQPPSAATTNNRPIDAAGGFSDGEHNSCESQLLWGHFTDSFRQVQSVLDRNRSLIQQVNENHRSQIHENMVKNIALIQEINDNVSKVVSLYADLSTNFSSMFHQGNAANDANNVNKN